MSVTILFTISHTWRSRIASYPSLEVVIFCFICVIFPYPCSTLHFHMKVGLVDSLLYSLPLPCNVNVKFIMRPRHFNCFFLIPSASSIFCLYFSLKHRHCSHVPSVVFSTSFCKNRISSTKSLFFICMILQHSLTQRRDYITLQFVSLFFVSNGIFQFINSSLSIWKSAFGIPMLLRISESHLHILPVNNS